MLSTLFRWELRALRRDPACWTALTLAVLALAFALLNGHRWRAQLDLTLATAAQRDLTARAEARTAAARLDATADTSVPPSRDPRTPAGYAGYGMAHFATLPAAPLAALTVGQSDLLPSKLQLVPAALPTLAANSEPENPRRLLLGRFDAAFAIIFLTPLFIIALAHALLAGERERGTLALLLTQPLTLRTLFVGKLAPRVLLALLLLALLAAAFLLFPPASRLSSSGLAASAAPRLALWLAVALAYGAFWFALSAAVVTRPGGTATHAVTLTAGWLAFALLIPAGINLAVKTLHPVPSRIELILALRAATDSATSEQSKLLAAYYEDHPEFAPANQVAGAAADANALRLASTAKIERDLAPVLARYESQLARQQSLVARLAFLSPALLAQSALADAAGTGTARHAAFVRQAVAHHAELRAFFNPRILRREKFTAWDDVPPFRYAEESTRTAATRIAPPLLALAAAALALTAFAWRTLRHTTL